MNILNNTITLTKQQLTEINTKLKTIQNILVILDVLLKPIEQLKQEKKYKSINDTINAKQAAEQYLTKYAKIIGDRTVEDIKNILKL